MEILLIMTLIPAFFFGLAHVKDPEKMWRRTHRLYVDGGDPTEFALIAARVGGVVLMGFSGVMLVAVVIWLLSYL